MTSWRIGGAAVAMMSTLSCVVHGADHHADNVASATASGLGTSGEPAQENTTLHALFDSIQTSAAEVAGATSSAIMAINSSLIGDLETLQPKALEESRAAALLLGITSSNKVMNCQGAPLCGVLTLESGNGDGYYDHKEASVHGLWPQTGAYGDSQCIAPQDGSDASAIPSCYKNEEAAKDPAHQLDFVNHEWEKHGHCAGAKDSNDFFGQVCSLASAPVAVIEKAKDAGHPFDDMIQAVKDAGYPVYDVDQKEDQIEISVCACSDGRWKIAGVSEFKSKCCGGSVPPSPPSPGPTPPSPSPSPSKGQCVTGRRGPPCNSDDDCNGLSGCVRCANSGYCTDQPRELSILV